MMDLCVYVFLSVCVCVCQSACLPSSQNTQEVKNKRFLISNRQNNLQILSANVAFDKATNGQTDIKHDGKKHLAQCHCEVKSSLPRKDEFGNVESEK